MSIDKRLISTEAAAVCTSDTLDVFGDSSCVALYGLNYDASDASGNYNGTPTNVTFNSPGYIDYAASFNGSSSFVNLGSTNQFASTAVSISMWIKPNSVTTSYALSGNGNGGSFADGDNDIFLRTDGYIGYEIGQSSSIYEARYATTTQLTVNSWHHVVVTYDSSLGTTIGKIYVNGISQSTSATYGAGGTFSGNIFIGTLNYNIGKNNYGLNFNGEIDQFRIFNKAISAAEVTKLYGEVACEYTCTTDTNGFPASASSNLVAYYKLDNDATDETGSHNGTSSNVTFNAGRFGQAGNFNGSSSYINFSDRVFNVALNGTLSEFSISLWFNSESVPSVHTELLSWWQTGTQTYKDGFLGLTGYSSNSIRFGDDWQDAYTFSSASEMINKWYHLVAIKTSTNAYIYLDGQLVSTKGSALEWGFNNNLAIGRQHGAGEYFDGKIDQIRLYDKALSSSEVTTLYEDEHQCYITVDSTDPFGDNSSLALYQLENNANDSTGSYNGSASNVTYSTDSVIGTYSGSFNGSNSYVNIGDQAGLRLLGSYSISFWVNLDVDTGIHRIINKDNANDYSGGYAIFANSRYLEVIHSTGSYNGFSVSTAFVIGEWNNFVVTFDSSNNSLKAYKNSVQVASTTTNGTLTNSGDRLFFGTYGSNSPLGQYLDGKLDQVRFFNKALDGSEIWKIYAEGVKG